MTGKVKWFNADKGYGFIINDEDGKEILYITAKLLLKDTSL